MNNHRCYVHSGRDHYAMGWFEHGYPRARKNFPARFMAEGVEYLATFKSSHIHRQQRGQWMAGRFFCWNPKGKVHLCTCPPLTKKQINEARERFEMEYGEMFREAAERAKAAGFEGGLFSTAQP